MSSITCAYHGDRPALTYCAGCGKALCGQCVVRLSTGNYCQVCASTPDLRPPGPPARSRTRWWLAAAGIAAGALLVARLVLR